MLTRTPEQRHCGDRLRYEASSPNPGRRQSVGVPRLSRTSPLRPFNQVELGLWGGSPPALTTSTSGWFFLPSRRLCFVRFTKGFLSRRVASTPAEHGRRPSSLYAGRDRGPRCAGPEGGEQGAVNRSSAA